MTKTFNITLASLVVLLIAFLGSHYVYGAVTTTKPTGAPGSLITYAFFSATTTNATSTNVNGGGGYFTIAGAKKVEIYASRGDTTGIGNAGQTQIKVQVTADGTTWNDYGKLIIATSTNQTMQSSLFLSSTSTTMVSLDLRTDTFFGVRCINVKVTDGEATCIAQGEF